MAVRAATAQEQKLLAKAGEVFFRRGCQIPGSVAARKRMRPQDFDYDQLAIGTAAELEHTSDPAVAMEIAMAHLDEHEEYYAALEAMEGRLRACALWPTRSRAKR